MGRQFYVLFAKGWRKTQKEFSMNNFFKAHIAPLIRIIALVAVIGFSMASCDSGGGDDNTGNTGITVDTGGTGGGNTDTNETGTFSNPFVGTWKSHDNSSGGDFVIVFVAGLMNQKFTITSPYGDLEDGTYEFSNINKTAQMTLKSGPNKGKTFNVSISGKTLTYGSRTYTYAGN